jgi:hypothetical protein
MEPSIKPASGVRLYYLDDAGVLFSEATQELHLLNTMAAVIWTLLEEGLDAKDSAIALQNMYGLDEARAREFVSSALAEWRRNRLVDDPSSGSAVPFVPPAQSFPQMGIEWREFIVAEERHYRLLSSHLTLRFSGEAQARIVHPILQHLAAAPSDGTIVIDVVETANGIAAYRDREFHAACAHLDQLAPIVKSLLWRTAVRDHRFFLDIHAGVVGDGNACILLPAAAGSGKSTLTAALVHDGFEYYSDEVALLEEGSFDVYPMPLAICVKKSGVEALAECFPQLRRFAVHRRGDGKDVIYLPPPNESLPSSNAARPVAAIVFPLYSAGASLCLQTLSKPEALKRLMDECLVVSMALDPVKVKALVRWIEKTPCYSLSYGSSEAAINAVRSVTSCVAYKL